MKRSTWWGSHFSLTTFKQIPIISIMSPKLLIQLYEVRIILKAPKGTFSLNGSLSLCISFAIIVKWMRENDGCTGTWFLSFSWQQISARSIKIICDFPFLLSRITSGFRGKKSVFFQRKWKRECLLKHYILWNKCRLDTLL